MDTSIAVPDPVSLSAMSAAPMLAELARLTEAERELDAQLHLVQSRIVDLIFQLLPNGAPESDLHRVHMSTGYDRRLIEALRTGQHSWRMSP